MPPLLTRLLSPLARARQLPEIRKAEGGAILSMSTGPWGGGKPGGDGTGSDGKGDNGPAGSPPPEGPRNPWTQPAGERRGQNEPRPSLVDDLLARGRKGFGGGNGGGFGGGRPGGGSPMQDGRQFLPLALGITVLLWVGMTSFHRVGPQERGVVTLLGSYSRTLTPGISLTLPAPFETVEIVDVEEIRTIDIGSVDADDRNLMLTRDQNLVDLAYSVRWNIKSPELFVFQLSEQDREKTIREVAESAMRAAVASVTLNDALGAGRTVIEQTITTNMQAILDGYRSGVRVQGVAIKQADPPAAVNDAFKAVSAAQQAAQTDVNQANAYAQQLTARAQGEAAAFDKVYTQYSLSPDVTRRRMYYETMESILAGIDKTIVESGNVTPYLPLPEVKRRAKTDEPQRGEQ